MLKVELLLSSPRRGKILRKWILMWIISKCCVRSGAGLQAAGKKAVLKVSFLVLSNRGLRKPSQALRCSRFEVPAQKEYFLMKWERYTQIKKLRVMNKDYTLLKEFYNYVALLNLWHNCVEWSRMKISHSNFRNEPVWLKNVRFGTHGLRIRPNSNSHTHTLHNTTKRMNALQGSWKISIMIMRSLIDFRTKIILVLEIHIYSVISAVAPVSVKVCCLY